jgi:hypothetical protein
VQKEGMLPFIASAADIYDIMYFLRAENRRLFMEII